VRNSLMRLPLNRLANRTPSLRLLGGLPAGLSRAVQSYAALSDFPLDPVVAAPSIGAAMRQRFVERT
jgi:hypothetical protein